MHAPCAIATFRCSSRANHYPYSDFPFQYLSLPTIYTDTQKGTYRVFYPTHPKIPPREWAKSATKSNSGTNVPKTRETARKAQLRRFNPTTA